MMLAAGYNPYGGDFTICFWKEAIEASMLENVANERLVLEDMETSRSSSLVLSVADLGMMLC